MELICYCLVGCLVECRHFYWGEQGGSNPAAVAMALMCFKCSICITFLFSLVVYRHAFQIRMLGLYLVTPSMWSSIVIGDVVVMAYWREAIMII